MRETLFAEMKGASRKTTARCHRPTARPLHAEEGAQHPIFCRRPRDGEGAERIVLDANKEAEGTDYFKIGDVDHDPAQRLAAWSADRKGSEYFTVRLRDIESGRDLEDEVPDTSPGIAWDASGTSFLYTQVDDEHRPLKVFRHVVGTPTRDDKLVYQEKDEGFFVGVGKVQSGKWLVISSHDHQTSELYLIPADAPATAPMLVAAREDGVEYALEHDAPRGRFLILTNLDAEDFKIVEAPEGAPGRENWRDVIPHRPGTLVLDHVCYRDHHVRLERRDGLPRIAIRRLADGDEHEIAFDEEAYDLNMGAGYEYETRRLRFSYSSMTTPAEVYDYDVETRERALRKRQEVPSGRNPADYVTRRIFATAADSTEVPMSILHRKGLKLDGSAPACFTAMALTASAFRHRFRPPACRSPIAALSMRSRIFAAARRRAIAGTATAS